MTTRRLGSGHRVARAIVVIVGGLAVPLALSGCALGVEAEMRDELTLRAMTVREGFAEVVNNGTVADTEALASSTSSGIWDPEEPLAEAFSSVGSTMILDRDADSTDPSATYWLYARRQTGGGWTYQSHDLGLCVNVSITQSGDATLIDQECPKVFAQWINSDIGILRLSNLGL